MIPSMLLIRVDMQVYPGGLEELQVTLLKMIGFR